VAVSDRRRVERALVNLLDNALRAEPAGGAVVASVAESDDCVRITIEDHGAGMDPDTLERAFEPFFTTRSPGEGTGLGLAFAREVILGAGGAIDMESAPGAGTRAEVRLPLRVLAESRAA
jgi:signal transduction histidine kinase